MYYSPLKSTIRVVLGQQIFNKTTDVTQTFEIEKYILHPQYSVFNPTDHDIGEYFCSDSFIFHLLDLALSLDSLLKTAFSVEKSQILGEAFECRGFLILPGLKQHLKARQIHMKNKLQILNNYDN